MTPEAQSIPFGFCQCGCGQKTKLSAYTDKRDGTIKGQPTRFLSGHNRVIRRVESRIVVVDGVECRTIPLTQGQTSIVDIGDYESVSSFNWFAKWDEATHSFYAVRNKWFEDEGYYRIASLHCELLGLAPYDEYEADHINHDTLDNRRANLRPATDPQNQWNRRMQRNNTSGYKGVQRHWKKWRYIIRTNGKTIRVGGFLTASAAFEARCKAVAQLHGEFACNG